MNDAPRPFTHGDLVQVAADLGPSMRHFTANCRAIVEYTYASKYGGDDHKSVGLYLEGKGSVAWYYAHQLTLIESNRKDLLAQWQQDAATLRKQQGDLAWVFANWQAIKNSVPGASVEALGARLGIHGLWGSRGEGVVYYTNALRILAYCESWLSSGNLAGFLEAHPSPTSQP